MRGKNDRPVVRHLVQLRNEDRTHVLETIDDVAVVDDFVTHVDGSTEPLERELYDLDGAIDAGAEAARRSDEQSEGREAGHCLPRCKASLAGFEAASYDDSRSPLRKSIPVKLRLIPLLLIALLPACAKRGVIDQGGVWTRRSACPVTAIASGTGDVTTFNPANSTDSAAIDVSAAMTNLRSTSDETGDQILSTVSFDVVGVRRDPGPARQVVLPYFDVVVQAGNQIVAKKVGYVALNFADGQIKARTAGQATARVHRGAATLPADVQKILTRERKPGDPEAAVDPLSDPAVRAAVAKATFEHIVGFNLTQDQLRYNVTR